MAQGFFIGFFQACWSAVGAKVGLLHRFIVGMFGIEA
jgi:hypothetical protein